MDGRDDRLDPLRSFTANSFRLDPERWREFVTMEDNQVVLNSFFSTPDYTNLFISRDSEAGLRVGLDFPKNVQTKVICVSKTGREVITKDNARKMLIIQEVLGEDAISFIIAISEEQPGDQQQLGVRRGRRGSEVRGRQKNEALVIKAQIEGLTFLPHPDVLQDDHRPGNAVHDDAPHDDGVREGAPRDEPLRDNAEGWKLSDVKLLHACDSTIIEWAELVSEFLKQDSSQPVLDGLKPLPSEEFNFWKTRLKNLHFIQQQLTSSRAQQVASIVQKAESVYWATLRDLYRDVQQGLKEAEDVTLNLGPVQEKLEQVEQMEYQQLGDNMAAVMEEMCLLWIRSEFYCKPCRMVVLLQEICNLFLQMSRKFLRGEEVMRCLVSDPVPVLDDVRLVIRTLQTLKEAYNQTRTQLEEDQNQNQSCWDFPSHLVFVHMDNFLLRMHSIQEVFSVSLQLYQLDQAVLSGVGGRKWSDVVQEVYQDFLGHVTVLSDFTCDPTDPDDQSFQLQLAQFQAQVWDLERRLVSVLSTAFEDCSSVSSAAKLAKMFGFILVRPGIQDQLRPHLRRLVQMVLEELDHTERLFHSQRERPGHVGPLPPEGCSHALLEPAAQAPSWRHTGTLHCCPEPDSGVSQQVLQRFQQVVDVLQDFGDGVRSAWSSQLDSDCGFILQQPLLQHNQQGMLGVNCSYKLEAVLRQLRCVSRETDVELHPLAARLYTCIDDITQSYLSLSRTMSCYSQAVSDAPQEEIPLTQNQLQDLNRTLSDLQRTTWSCEGVLQLVEQQRHRVMMFHATVSQARANMDAMTRIIQGWAELQLLQRSADSLLEGGATEQSCRRIRDEGQELLRLTQVNRSLYAAEDSSESWITYLDHIDDKVQHGLFHMLLRSLHFLSDNMNPQSSSSVFLAISLQLQETGSVFEPSVGGGLTDLLKSIISDIYTAASLPPRISVSRHGNYQECLQKNPELCALEQEVMRVLVQVREEAGLLKLQLDRFSFLWTRDRTAAMDEFLTYSRQLGRDEMEADQVPPALRDFSREIESLDRLRAEVTQLDDVVVLHSWLQVDLRPFRDSLLSVLHHWRHLYTDYLLRAVSDSLKEVTQRGEDEESSSSSRFPLTETILLLEAAGVELPEHMAAQLQC
ncbi:hypothetical protein EPR50_G00133070 [Perca flavescens]|uniref:Dynein heavy chain tail domain-containing protein n=1 Tax=Perca flavescens TaxID=8167 RepID=A0A484CUH8_PERFV|nr:hypothetical protein EPR50_G00133070 [Perca flavescens]